MDIDVGELALRTGLSVDTIRYYQSMGLLPPPARHGRHAVYDAGHVARLERIRDLAARGFSLKSMREVLADARGAAAEPVLLAAIEERPDDAAASYAPREFAKALGIPYALLRSVERTGIVEPQRDARGEARYSETDLAVARGALKLLDRGIPLTDLVALAARHHRATRAVVDRAIDLFDDHVRKRAAHDADVAEAFRELLPVVSGAVAHHFQRLLVNRALDRLERRGETRSWRTALKTATRARLRLRWR